MSSHDVSFVFYFLLGWVTMDLIRWSYRRWKRRAILKRMGLAIRKYVDELNEFKQKEQ